MSSRRPDEPVRLTKIYTRGGDRGETSLGDGSRVSKLDPRVAAYGAVDELNSQLGLVLALEDLGGELGDPLRRIQNDLFDVGADISVPHGGDRERLRLVPEQTEWLEHACDEVNATLEPLKSFVLPGGTPSATYLHLARTVCRRAERLMVALAETDGETVSKPALQFINRLSDHLFVASRFLNHKDRGDVLWVPGQNR